MKKEKYTELLAKQLSGNASANEQEALRNWRAENEENEQFAQKAEKLWKLSANYKEKPFAADTKAAWQKVEAKLGTKKNSTEVIRMRTLKSLARIAAVFVLLIGVYSLWQTRRGIDEGALTLTVETQRGENKEIQLPDGSTVWLNEYSTLMYYKDFKKRNVTLRGEAFFEVARMEESPFRILSQGATTEVLGTSFNIRAYPKEQEVKLTVKTGKVAFSGKNGKAILAIGETAAFQKEEKIIIKQEIVDVNDFAWQTKSLEFEGLPLKTVEKTLEHYYGIEIEVKNESVLSCRFNGGKFENPALGEMLEILSIALDLEITKEGEKFIVKGEGCD